LTLSEKIVYPPRKKKDEYVMKLWYGRPIPFVKEQEYFTSLLEKNINAVAREGTMVDVHCLKTGYLAPTYTWTESYNAVEGIKRYYEAWKKGYDGVIIGCAHDPGLMEARSLIDIPVAGVFQSAVLIASSLGKMFSVVTVHKSSKAAQIDKIKEYGLADKLASVRILNITPTEMAESYVADPSKLIDAFSEVAAKAAREDDAEAIVPGCTVLSTILTTQKLFEVEKVPIIDPVFAGVKMAETLVDLKNAFGIGVCRASIFKPPPAGWEKQVPLEF